MKRNFTKQFWLSTILTFLTVLGMAQNGLQKVVVEKYYITDVNDSIGSVGILPVGSTTYRVFLDMKQGYKFQTAYGSPTHTLFFNTSTSFFNNEDRGAVTPTFTKSQAKNNTVMLDSWLSAGASCAGNYGVLKSEDDGIATVVNADGLLQNNDPLAGIPLTDQDGLLTGTPGSVTMIGIDDQVAVFDATSQAGSSFITTNGAWSCLSGATGSDTTNKVLIAQITTDGILTFELNIQIGTPDGGVEQYVARDPVGQETALPSLTFNSEIFAGIDEPSTIAIESEITSSIFPNPASSKTELLIKTEKSCQDCNYRIYDLLGNLVLQKSIGKIFGNHSEIIDLSTLPGGIYIVLVKTDGKSSAIKLVKK